jgi:hypothetical protein
MTKPVDITKQSFGLLTAEMRVGSKNGAALWRCRCICGRKVNVRVDFLKAGKRKQCHIDHHPRESASDLGID